MGWFRSRSRFPSYLALFALALQLVLSFGHVHFDDEDAPASERSALWGVHASAATTGADDHAGKETPALPDDCCPICTLIHLAGTLVAAEPPSLPLPIALARLRIEPAVEFDLTSSRRAPFGARAPPLA
jgi:Protein of unknown function (DUF2946)